MLLLARVLGVAATDIAAVAVAVKALGKISTNQEYFSLEDFDLKDA